MSMCSGSVGDLKFTKNQIAWASFDAGVWGLQSALYGTYLALYYKQHVCRHHSAKDATMFWGYTSSAAMLFGAICSPMLGAWADTRRIRKRMILVCIALAIASLVFSVFMDVHVLLASLFTGLSSVFFMVEGGLYNSMLARVAERERVHSVSALGAALGNGGAGLLLAVIMLFTSVADLHPRDSHPLVTSSPAAGTGPQTGPQPDSEPISAAECGSFFCIKILEHAPGERRSPALI